MTEELLIDQSPMLLAAIVDSSDDAIISKNLKGIITSWNKGAQRIFGYTSQEAVGQSILLLVPSNRLEEEPRILEQLERGETIDHFETIRQTKGGELLNISLTISPIKDASGKIIGASKIARDITERRRVERALQEAQKKLQFYADDLEKQIQERTRILQKTVAELEAFSYSLSHDMRAPLRAIQGFLEIIVEEHAKQIDASGVALLQRVINAAARMDRMILDLLTFTRLSHEVMTIEPVDVEKLIQSAIQERAEFQAPHAEIIIETPLFEVMGNKASLTQCITNLLDNAVKFVTPQVNPQVRIRSERRGALVRLWFEDNGIGIDVDAQKRLFQMFQRVRGNEYPGTGIGLAIVRKATERMGGEAGIDSEPGKGSRFWLQLPGVGV